MVTHRAVPPYITMTLHDHLLSEHGFFLLGGNGNNFTYIATRQPMLEKSFFTAVHLNGRLLMFGGNVNSEKLQLKTCEVYEIARDEWNVSPC